MSRREPPTASPLMRWRLIAQGVVQGVGYREACRRAAVGLGLAGWVRNRPDGTVEIEAEGQLSQLNDFRLWCDKGPLHARVNRVVTSQIPVTGEDWFEVRS
ncbi:acylphosphatase [Synechococcus sp. CCY9201]|uniref:acylphosphatase n=1 Tax=unclassified Synechococcus TaxID=2626047 RepID=UPI001E36FDE0|nr:MULTISPECIES: acylphosphatase [unclassified Synechococcus]MEA5422311.1 acylphosphatase [Synechococcus sp. CCY9202]MEA5475344.1 acylphosphatase [Synechococcus sp. CCY9201]